MSVTHIVSAPMDMRGFNRWAAQRGLVRRGAFDEGFALHILLSAILGKGVLQPCRLFWSPRRRSATLFGYADVDQDDLRDMAHQVGTPDCLEVLDVPSLRSKPMRTSYSPGQRLGFDIRIRPVRRLHGDVTLDGRLFAKGSEVDAFVMAVQHEPRDTTEPRERATARRCAVYAQWLAERFGDGAAVDPTECRLAGFRRTRAVRGDGPGPEGPDATIHGELTVKTPDVFAAQVRRGLGRHKAYGYGMLLLRPPRTRRGMGR